MRTLGIDVSHWEGVIDWMKAAPVIGFCYYKCTDGVIAVDEQFSINAHNAKLANIPDAPFHWWQPNQDPAIQARHFVAIAHEIAGRTYKRYIVDIEDRNESPVLTQAGRWSRINILLTVIENMTSTKPVIYTSPGYWNEMIGNNGLFRASTYDLILARYCYAKNPVPPMPWAYYKKQPIAWQFTDYGFCPGVGGPVDMDWFYGTPDECRAYFGAGS